MKVEVAQQAIYRPHRPVECRLNLPDQDIKVRVLEPFRQLGVDRPVGPIRPGPEYGKLAAKLEEHFNPDELWTLQGLEAKAAGKLLDEVYDEWVIMAWIELCCVMLVPEESGDDKGRRGGEEYSFVQKN